MAQTVRIPKTIKKAKHNHRLGTAPIFLNVFSRLSLSNASLSDKSKELFFSEMAMMLHSGVDIHKSLTIVAAEFERRKESTLLSKLIEELVSGQNLSEAMESCKGFSMVDTSVTRIGESSGLLADSFKFLADYYSRKIKQRTLMSNAVSYPVFVLAFAVVAVGFLLNNVVPIFSTIYQRMEGELPLITRVVVGISERMPLFLLILFLLTSAIIVLIYLYKTSPGLNGFMASIFLSTPLLRGVLMVNFLERFNRVMAMLTSSRVPLVDSVSLSKDTVTLAPIRSQLSVIEQNLFAGVPLWLAMENTKLFPRRVVSLVKMGEEINQLDSVFTNLANQYSAIQEKKLKSLGTYLEPALIVIIGALVGLILVAIYLPMFKLGGQFV